MSICVVFCHFLKFVNRFGISPLLEYTIFFHEIYHYGLELPGLINEFFADEKGRIILPEGSSLSQWASRGVETFTDEAVTITKVIASMI
jgi:hypothetical protein